MANLSPLTSGSALSSLLSKVTSSQSQSRETTNEKPTVPSSSQSDLSNTSPTVPSPLQALMSSMMQGQTTMLGAEGGQGEGGMFAMLQNICGKVGQIRVKELKSETEEEQDSEQAKQEQRFVILIYSKG